MIENSGEEKKVEYIELIYDLIFVYLIGRNNGILHHIEGGFVTLEAFFAYIMCTLAVIQIWSFTTVYINLHGRNSLRDHIFLFINMYLLYHLGNGIEAAWRDDFYEFNIAWILILVNIAVQYFLEARNQKNMPWAISALKQQGLIIVAECVLILVHILIYYLTGVSTAYIPIIFGIVISFFTGHIFSMFPVDFMHLTERIMLYVVFTFGEMIIAISSYFDGGFSANSLYFSIIAFLIVVGLFISYEVFYNMIIDREAISNGLVYMLIHVFLILSLNNISVALEFMREEEVALLPKVLFITISILVYFICLFILGMFAKKKCVFNARFFLRMIILSVAFAVLMIIFREDMYVNIAVTAVYVLIMSLVIFRHGKYNIQENAT